MAIKAAQRLCGRAGGIPRPASLPRALSRAASTQHLSSSSSSSAGFSNGIGKGLSNGIGNGIGSGIGNGAASSAAASVGLAPAVGVSAGMTSSELAAAVAAAAAAAAASPTSLPLSSAGLVTSPVPPVGLASPMPSVSVALPAVTLTRASSEEQALNALRASGGMLARSGSITPPPTSAAAVHVAPGSALAHQQLLRQLAPAVGGAGVHVPSIPLMNSAGPFQRYMH